jgi:hypothetical protein
VFILGRSLPKICKYPGCDKAGAYGTKELCNFHWDLQIDENIKKLVAEQKKKNP